jgi:hypothetical protein
VGEVIGSISYGGMGYLTYLKKKKKKNSFQQNVSKGLQFDPGQQHHDFFSTYQKKKKEKKRSRLF